MLDAGFDSDELELVAVVELGNVERELLLPELVVDGEPELLGRSSSRDRLRQSRRSLLLPRSLSLRR